jgi:hypothetical protein|tara:strand:+ start:4835 stop:5041 length:207 start_codon:yes stop_codon:yes gene_type:complete
MKALVWVKIEELETSHIKDVHTKCPKKCSADYIQISIEVDEYIRIKEEAKTEWLKEQHNRNRQPKDWK